MQDDQTQSPFTISYADAATWLENLPVEDREDQIRDYALLGLASLLGLDIEQLRNALYDQTPVRDPLFWDMAANQSGPGRGLLDGNDTLHVLVPTDDPYVDRTIGMVLDDHRKNVGSDAEQVVLYRYSIDTEKQEILLQPELGQSTSAVRNAHGYVEMAVGTLIELQRFLDQTQHLSQIAIVNGEVHAGGWNWPGVPAGEVTAEDLTVLQRGYVNARGAPATVVQFLTTVVPEEYGIDITIPAEVKAAAEELDAFLTTLAQADSNAEYDAVLIEHEEVIMDVVLDDSVAQQLQSERTTQRETIWLNNFWEALVAAFEANELWGLLLYVAEGQFYLPEPGVTEPGFSLDPGPTMPMPTLLSILRTSLYPELAGHDAEIIRFFQGWRADSDAEAFWGFMTGQEEFIQEVILIEQEAVEAQRLLDIMYSNSPEEERTQAVIAYLELIDTALKAPDRPWALLSNTIDGKPPYQYARYDGGLQGTEAGMTYFYTDILAKGYFYELGSGNPYGIVEGFLPESKSTVPWSHCVTGDQEGRIWFGLREEAVGIFPERVTLGGITTRVFVLMQDPLQGEIEIEPSFMFGQGVWWWDRHYLEMADYEPQYHRLDQLMRWGAAIAWLVEQGDVLLPQVRSELITEEWRFGDWLAAHPELTWQYDLPFVEVPDQPTETVLRLFSKPFDQCGRNWVTSGGISNPSMWRIAEIAEQQPKLPATVARAGLNAAETDYSRIRKSGTIASLNGIQRTLPAIDSNETTISVLAEGRKVWSLGDVKVALPETTPRRLEVSMSQEQEMTAWQMTVQDVELGTLSVQTTDNTVALTWDEGPLAHIKPLVDELQEQLLDIALEEALGGVDGIIAMEQDESSGDYHVQLAIEYLGSPMILVISTEAPTESEGLGFRLAQPIEEEGAVTGITWYYVSFESNTVQPDN